jgi:hypothetical protein
MSNNQSNGATTDALDITDAYALIMRGTFQNISPVEERGKYQKRTVDIKRGKYTTTFEFFGETLPEGLDDFAAGDEVAVRFWISRREYNGRVYTSLKAKSIERIGAEAEADEADADADLGAEMPF